MELEKIEINGLNGIYTLDVVQKEFRKAVDEPWKDNPPWQRYQKKLLQDLAVLDDYKESAIEFQQYERLSTEEKLFSIRHPETPKNVRVIYTITEGVVILLHAFLEKNDGDYQKAIRVAKNRLKVLES